MPVLQAILSRIQVTLHVTRRRPHGASHLELMTYNRSVESRGAPSRQCRNERVHRPTTTVLNHNGYALPPPSPVPKQVNYIDAVVQVQKFPPYKRWFGGMRLTLHAARPTPDGASRLVQAMFGWSVKIRRRAPFRHCRDARVYGHTTNPPEDKY